MHSLAQRAMGGAQKVIRECLRLDSTTPLAIFSDETSSDVVGVLRTAALDSGVPVKEYGVPLAEQQAFRPENGLPFRWDEYLEECHGVLTCFAADPTATAFRLELVRQATQRDKRVGHMPGANLNVLAYAVNIDYKSVQQKCDDLAFALTVGSTARLTTYMWNGDPRVLELDLGGVDRSAVLSTGVLASGTWGNLPGGETFIAPVEGKAQGSFVLNGAFHAHVMRRGTALVLEFSNGRVADVVSGPAAVVAKFRNLFANPNGHGADSWRTLAELGVGVNDGIRRLTGNSLFDEKCLGTVHIALGDNATFGGNSQSDFHEDLVTLQPSLDVDGRPILDRGRYAFKSREWREDITTYPVDPVLRGKSARVMKGLIPAREEHGALVVERRISDGRINRYTVGNRESTGVLAAIYSDIPKGPFRIELAALQRSVHNRLPEVDRQLLTRGLSILARHCLVAITEA